MGRSNREEPDRTKDLMDSSLSAFFKYVPQSECNNLTNDEKPPTSPEIPYQVNLHNLQNLSTAALGRRAHLRGAAGADPFLLEDTDTSANLLNPLARNTRATCITQKLNFRKIDDEQIIGNIKVLKLDHLTVASSKEEVVTESPAFLLKGFNNFKRNSLTSSLMSAHDEQQVRYRYSYIGKKFSQLKSKPQEGFDSGVGSLTEGREQELPEPKLVSSCCCKSSRCVKLYCECFKSKGFCGESCRCTECLNQKNTPEAREAAISKYVQKRVKTCPGEIPPALLEKGVEEAFFATNKAREDLATCRCKVSACTNRYCGCYSDNQACKPTCTCVNCLNTASAMEVMRKNAN